MHNLPIQHHTYYCWNTFTNSASHLLLWGYLNLSASSCSVSRVRTHASRRGNSVISLLEMSRSRRQGRSHTLSVNSFSLLPESNNGMSNFHTQHQHSIKNNALTQQSTSASPNHWILRNCSLSLNALLLLNNDEQCLYTLLTTLSLQSHKWPT